MFQLLVRPIDILDNLYHSIMKPRIRTLGSLNAHNVKDFIVKLVNQLFHQFIVQYQTIREDITFTRQNRQINYGMIGVAKNVKTDNNDYYFIYNFIVMLTNKESETK